MRKINGAVLAILAVVMCGCIPAKRFANDTLEYCTMHLGSLSWAYNASLGNGKVVTANERTADNEMLRGTFVGIGECYDVQYDMTLESGVVVKCYAIFPKLWNGKLWVLGCDEGPGGAFPEKGVSFASDGSVVVMCDGGTGQIRHRNGRINSIAAGARSSNVRRAFFKESLLAALEGGKILIDRCYGRPADKVYGFGRETGATQIMFLSEHLDGRVLVNPVLDFAKLAAYDLHVARNDEAGLGRGTIKRSQWEAIQWAARELKIDKFDESTNDGLFRKAGEQDPAFVHFRSSVNSVYTAWTALLKGGKISSGDKSIDALPITFEMNFQNRMRRRPWRIAWIFGEYECGDNVTDAKFMSRVDEMNEYSLSPESLSGSDNNAVRKTLLIIESANANVPAASLEALKLSSSDQFEIRRVSSIGNDRYLVENFDK